jgi:hypothetical protein
MKNLISTLVLSFFTASCAFAQTFSMSPDTVSINAPAEQYDVEVHNDMTNLTSDTVQMKWERTILINPNNLDVQICDLDACFAPWIDTNIFPLPGDTTIPIITHILNPESIEPYYAVVQLKLYDDANPDAAEYSYYIFNIGVSGTNNPAPAANVKLFPNPVVESFSLDNADEVHRVLVFSTDGRQVAAFDASMGNSYSIAGQPAGTYMVALEAKDGKVFQTVQVRKD